MPFVGMFPSDLCSGCYKPYNTKKHLFTAGFFKENVRYLV